MEPESRGRIQLILCRKIEFMKTIHKKLLIVLIIFAAIVALTVLIMSQSFTKQSVQQPFTQNQSSHSVEPVASSTASVPETNNMGGIKTYRNTKFGFEFQYPEDLEFTENSFGGPFSKFNLILEKNLKDYNPFNPSFLINIVTPDFADSAIINRENLRGNTSDFVLKEIHGKKYEYVFEGLSKISIDIPFGEYRMLLSANKDYEGVFNQILASFKFLK